MPYAAWRAQADGPPENGQLGERAGPQELDQEPIGFVDMEDVYRVSAVGAKVYRGRRRLRGHLDPAG